jgi:hypothetical protein
MENAPQPGQQSVHWVGRNQIDYTDYVDDHPSSGVSGIHLPSEEQVDASLQHESARTETLKEREDVQQYDNHRGVAVISAINRNQRHQCNQCNQSEAISPQMVFQCEDTEGDIVPVVTDESLKTQQACVPALQKNRCPHHPHTRWVRFDPVGQAWCDRMDCWDCYRLMKIGEALDYHSLAEYTRGIVKLEQGIEAWSSFVTAQGSFAVLTATQYAIDLCKAMGVEVPDLSGEVKRLVPIRE